MPVYSQALNPCQERIRPEEVSALQQQEPEPGELEPERRVEPIPEAEAPKG